MKEHSPAKKARLRSTVWKLRSLTTQPTSSKGTHSLNTLLIYCRQNAVLKNMENLYDREKRRYNNLKSQFDDELLRQSPIEREVKDIMRKFLKAAFFQRIKRQDDEDIDTQIERIEVDPEFYRLGLTREERKALVDLLLRNPRIQASLDDKLTISPDIDLNFTDSDFEELGNDFFKKDKVEEEE